MTELQQQAAEIEFNTYMKEAKKICKDFYGLGSKKYNIMMEKLNKCENVIQISNAMTWGRMNLQTR